MIQRISGSFPIRSYPYRVYYADTDAGGVVYYAQYLRMFEQTRTLYMEDCGLSLTEWAEKNCLFVCRRAEIDYLSPAKLGDTLDIATGIAELGHTFVTFAYEIICLNRLDEKGEGLLISRGFTKIVSVGEKAGRMAPIRFPQAVFAALNQPIVNLPE